MQIKIIRETQITSHQLERPVSKNPQTINAGKDEEKGTLLHSGNINCYSHYGEQYGGSLKN